ncbi:MAG: DUF2442 domain-containing protein [Pseudomonadota bacterium]
MKIVQLSPRPNGVLAIVSDDGRVGDFDVVPYFGYEAFERLRDHDEFVKIHNGGYFVEWDCGADLSVDTIEAKWQIIGHSITVEEWDERIEADARAGKFDALAAEALAEYHAGQAREF